jgi:hypothetical protein
VLDMCAVILGAGTGSLVATGIFAKTRAASKVRWNGRNLSMRDVGPRFSADFGFWLAEMRDKTGLPGRCNES